MISKKAFIVSLVYLSSLYRASSTNPYPIDMTASRTYEKYFTREEHESEISKIKEEHEDKLSLLRKNLDASKKRIKDLEKDNEILDLILRKQI